MRPATMALAQRALHAISRVLGCMSIAGLLACAPTPAELYTPSDDPADWDAQIDRSQRYAAQVSAPRFIVPGPGLPASVVPDKANNNVDIVSHGGRLFMAWRTAPSHFASSAARLIIVSSRDEGLTFEREHEISLGADLREPRLLSFAGRLWLYFVELGKNPLAFEPRRVWRVEREAFGSWTEPVDAGLPKEVVWALRQRGGVAYMTSYSGEHYGAGAPALAVHLRRSGDGIHWEHVDASRPAVYRGGVSEAAFEFDRAGDLWAVTRNEDGDASGFGSHLCHARAGASSQWECPDVSDPQRYDSPWMFRHGDDIYLAARRDVGGPYDLGRTDLSFAEQKSEYLAAYSLRPKRFALYRVDTVDRAVRHIVDLPGVGDTAFPSVRQVGPHRFLLANYTAPLDDPDKSWLSAQVSPRGTQIYWLTLNFIPQGPKGP